MFGSPAAAAPGPAGVAAATAAPVAVLVEAAAGTAGVVQLLSGGEGAAPYPSSTANAIVLSSRSRQSGDNIDGAPLSTDGTLRRLNSTNGGGGGVVR